MWTRTAECATTNKKKEKERERERGGGGGGRGSTDRQTGTERSRDTREKKGTGQYEITKKKINDANPPSKPSKRVCRSRHRAKSSVHKNSDVGRDQRRDKGGVWHGKIQNNIRPA